jgi:hypothetical protein
MALALKARASHTPFLQKRNCGWQTRNPLLKYGALCSPGSNSLLDLAKHERLQRPTPWETKPRKATTADRHKKKKTPKASALAKAGIQKRVFDWKIRRAPELHRALPGHKTPFHLEIHFYFSYPPPSRSEKKVDFEFF